jgi:hypothetical protein
MGWDGGAAAVGSSGESPAALMHGPMMRPTEQGEVGRSVGPPSSRLARCWPSHLASGRGQSGTTQPRSRTARAVRWGAGEMTRVVRTTLAALAPIRSRPRSQAAVEPAARSASAPAAPPRPRWPVAGATGRPGGPGAAAAQGPPRPPARPGAGLGRRRGAGRCGWPGRPAGWVAGEAAQSTVYSGPWGEPINPTPTQAPNRNLWTLMSGTTFGPHRACSRSVRHRGERPRPPCQVTTWGPKTPATEAGTCWDPTSPGPTAPAPRTEPTSAGTSGSRSFPDLPEPPSAEAWHTGGRGGRSGRRRSGSRRCGRSRR